MIHKFWRELVDFFSDREDPEEPAYDPVHLAAMVVVVVFSIGALFWLLWTLLVFRGGLFPKVLPALEVLFTSKTLQDFGWVGYPFEMGVFNGFVGNLVALALSLGLLTGIWLIFKNKE